MPTVCGVPGCKLQHSKGDDVRYHSVPKKYKEEWLRAINWPPGEAVPRNLRVCSRHFAEDAYGRNLLMLKAACGTSKHARLKPGALPTLALRSVSVTTHESVDDFDLETLLPGSSIKVTSSTQTYPNCSNRGCQAMPDSRTRGTLTFPDLRNRGTQAFIESRSKGCQVFTRETQAAKDRSVGCQADIKPNVHRSTQTDFKDIPTSPQKKAGRHSSGNPSHGPPVSSEQHDTTRSSSADDGRETAPCPGTQCAIISSSAEETSPSTARESIAEEPNYVVSDTQLLEALQYCRDCGTTDCRVQLSTEGHLVRAVITCKRSHARTWHSQRFQCDK
ncbi:uncharacterized protein LOC135375502 isoform X2 [Ornithodoros turicata]|uniref:uncharacterized protein LOC135375502 isoform X2 n=1 Tax=Ornithodoros turicata TaxID=34597 RepID=UPI003139E05F